MARQSSVLFCLAHSHCIMVLTSRPSCFIHIPFAHVSEIFLLLPPYQQLITPASSREKKRNPFLFSTTPSGSFLFTTATTPPSTPISQQAVSPTKIKHQVDYLSNCGIYMDVCARVLARVSLSITTESEEGKIERYEPSTGIQNILHSYALFAALRHKLRRERRSRDAHCTEKQQDTTGDMG